MKDLILFFVCFIFVTTAKSQFYDITEPMKLGGAVNSAAEETIPVFSSDSSFLYFVRTYDSQNTGGENDQDIWFSIRDERGVYSTAKLLKDLNNKFNNAVLGVSNDGNRLYVLNAYEGKRDQDKGISVSEKKGSGWSTPEKINIPGLSIDGDFYGFHVSGDERVILISYEGPNTVGKEDLYVSVKEGSTWSAPIHMGNVINTEGYEISPFLSPGNDTLYFSSNGHGGFGDADIFYSVKKGSWSDWTKPENLGSRVNSPKFDAYFILSDEKLYWSSNRESERSNIYYASIIPPPNFDIACETIDVSVFEGNDGTASVNIKSGVAPYSYEWSTGSNEQKISGLLAGKYEVKVTDAYGRSESCSFEIAQPEKPVLKPIEDIIYFDLNSSYLNAESIQVLDDLIQRLQERPELNVFVESHCDIRADSDYNIWLSERRMTRTITYLESNGVAANRISGDYKGKKTPLIDCQDKCTEEEHRINRRTTLTTM